MLLESGTRKVGEALVLSKRVQAAHFAASAPTRGLRGAEPRGRIIGSSKIPRSADQRHCETMIGLIFGEIKLVSYWKNSNKHQVESEALLRYLGR